jgi:hypothetical protein
MNVVKSVLVIAILLSHGVLVAVDFIGPGSVDFHLREDGKPADPEHPRPVELAFATKFSVRR